MDPVRIGLGIRALRRRRAWTQADLAARAGMSQSAISRIERGDGDRLTVQALDRVATALGARLRITLLAQGEDLDRLLDGDHAAVVERVVGLLRRTGWEVAPEVTFSVYGERGSIDILAFHPETGALLVIEVKSAIPDVQAALAGLDRKVRLALGSPRNAAGGRRACRAGSSCRVTGPPGGASMRTRRRSGRCSLRGPWRFAAGPRGRSEPWRGSCLCHLAPRRVVDIGFDRDERDLVTGSPHTGT